MLFEFYDLKNVKNPEYFADQNILKNSKIFLFIAYFINFVLFSIFLNKFNEVLTKLCEIDFK